jgi:hypothetical protein
MPTFTFETRVVVPVVDALRVGYKKSKDMIGRKMRKPEKCADLFCII